MRREFNLDKRLFECANMVPQNSKLVDIGTDHAYLPIWLVLHDIVSDAIAVDVRKEPLERASNNIKKYGLDSKIKTRLSNGFDNLEKNECETVVIAGMGAETIISILDRTGWLKNCEMINLILQPMTAAEKLRRYLSSNGYYLYLEKAVESNSKIYSVMGVKPGKEKDENLLFPYIGKIFYSTPKNILEVKASIQYAEKEIINLLNRLKGLQVCGELYESEKLREVIQSIRKEIVNYNEKYSGNL